MSQQRGASGEEGAGSREEAQEERDRERAGAEQGNFGDRAAQARLADDPRIKAPRDRAGMPSIGDEQL